MNNHQLVRSTFYINGMHCASCEILIEKKIIKENSVEMVDASLSQNLVTVEHQAEDRISASYLNSLFKEDGYRFSNTPFKKVKTIASDSHCAVPEPANPLSTLFIVGLLIIGFLLLNKTGFTSLISVSTTSSLPIFLIFGLLAGFSSCAALIGGIILSVSKQWVGNYGNSDNVLEKLQPHLLFNVGRVLGYTLFGALLGLLGNYFRLSPIFTATLVILVSGLMIMLGLQMLGVKALANFQIHLPKSITGKIADESNFSGRFAPALMGALTFFLPCGFTLTTQALALASGNPVQGALIMGLFALGTMPGLLAIGYGSVKLHSNPKTSAQFPIIAGYLVLFFALFNINSQLTVIGLPNFSDVLAVSSSPKSVITSAATVNLVPQVNGKQIITMSASSSGYSPNQFTVKAGVPVQWNITADGYVGCAGTIVSRGLFPDAIYLTPGTTTTKEFTPAAPGTYRFSCSMGMYTGTIVVVDSSGSAGTTTSAAPIGSGSKGCGCGGSGGAGGSCGGSR